MSDCDTYMWPAPKVTTQLMSGFSGSVTKACSTWLSIGSFSMPALRSTSDVLPATATPTFGARIVPRLRDDADDAVALLQEAGHLAVLDDVDAEPVGGVREAPGDGVVARGAGARLQQPADDGKARVVAEVEAGAELGDLLGHQKLGVDAVEPHGVAALGDTGRAASADCARLSTPRCENMTL